MLIDTHCHIDGERFDADRDDVLARARAAGVARMITIGCDVDGSRRALQMAARHDDVYATAGVHPHEAEKAGPGFVEELEALLCDERCVGVGECGLDFYYDHSPRDVQRDVFVAQIALARRLKKPLVVHVRDAWDECLSLLESEGARDAGGVIHCFTGTREQARRSLALGFLLSIPGVVTFKNAGELQDVVREAPLESLLVETDSPYLAPVPFRGKRNEPAYVKAVAEKVAQLRGEPLDVVVEATGRNARRLFGLP